MADPSPTLDQLKERLTRFVSFASPFAGTVYRSSSPLYATERDLLTGEGSRLQGGRWNPKGIAVVYASLTPETAMAETLAQNRHYSVPIAEAMPRTFVAIDVNLEAILDFRQGSLRQRLQVSEQRILKVDWRREMLAGRDPITHLIGLAAHESRWEGLIVPSSAAPKDHNLLVFPEDLRATSYLRVLHADQL